MTLRYYIVTSAPWNYVEPVMDDGSGPTYETVDYFEVLAASPADARALAVHSWLHPGPWRRGQPTTEGEGTRERVRDGMSPFGGVKVEDVTDHMTGACGDQECLDSLEFDVSLLEGAPDA